MRAKDIWIGPFRSPLTRKVMGVIFVSILLIEIIIFLPSYQHELEHTLDDLENVGRQWAMAIGQNASASFTPEEIAQSILVSQDVRGVEVLENGEVVAKAGEWLENRPPVGQPFRSDNGIRYEVHYPVSVSGGLYSIILRLDSNYVDAQMWAFTLRIAGLVLIITIVLTAATVLAMGTIVLRPLSRLNDALERGSFNLDVTDGKEATRLDEIGEIYRASSIMLSQLQISQQWLEQKVAERTAELNEANERLRAITDNMPMMLNLKDSDGRYQFMNRQYADWIGVSEDELIGKSVFDALPESQARFLVRREELVMQTGVPQEFSTGNDSSGRAGDEIKQFIKFPIRGEDGDIGGIGTVVVDITERRRAEEALRRSEELLRMVFDTADIGIVQRTADGARRIMVNRAFCEMTGWSESELLSDPQIDVTHEEDADVAPATRRRLSHGGAVTSSNEFRIVRRNGEIRWVDSSVTVVRGLNGRVERYVSFIKDITRRKEAENQLMTAKEIADTASAAKSDLIAMVSHEVRTPMNGVLGMARLLRDSRLDADQRECLETVISSAEALLYIVNDLLDISKLEADRLELETRSFRIQDVIDQPVAVMSARAAEKGVAVIANMEAGVPPVLIGDGHRLRQVILNLISNGVKFTDHGQVVVEVRCLREGDDSVDLEFAVTDTGKGIEPEAQAKLFSPFTQGAVEVARKYGGTGLGLSICRRLVHLMGGEIKLESTPGEGATFRFSLSLPVDAEADPASLAGPAGGASLDAVTGPVRSLRLIQAEDNATNRAVVERMMQRAGHVVVSVDNGAELLEALETETFDAILMDRHMPTMDGIEATKRIRAMMGDLATIPIIGITAGAQEAELAACVDAGMDLVIAKPVDEADLVRTVNRLGAARRAQRIETGGTVLVVDDVAVNLAVTARQLRKLGIDYECLDDPVLALERLKAGGYAAAIVDVNMPVLSGTELTQRLREEGSDETRNTPIIAMTGYVTPEDRRRFFAAGMDAYLAKPATLEGMAQVLASCLDGDCATASEPDGPEAEDVGEGGADASLVQPVDLSELSETLGEDDETELMAMLDLFVQSFPELMVPLSNAVRDQNRGAIHDAAHAAKSAAASAAARPLSRLLFRMEREAADADLGDLNHLASRVDAEFDRVSDFVRSRS